MPDLAVILPAAGTSSRYGRNKLLELLDGKTVFERSLTALWEYEFTGEIWIATNDPTLTIPRNLMADVHVCPGGPTRAHSVLSALRQVPSSYPWVAIHDAARPLVSQELIDRTFTTAQKYGAAVPALPVHLTIKQAAGPLPAKVQRTVPRHDLWTMQTPQIMKREALLHAFDACPLPLEQITDDAQLLELAGHDVYLVQGDERNIKITTQMDRRVAELLLKNSNDEIRMTDQIRNSNDQ